ncbi:MAG: cupin domain-containing protein, partial [Gemmatimonadetes bacterium]|nr:cupin domain-containing protein [Gemmatimonadota bacterium]NIQ57821.1 cupin domain-containing protein [Gemmatimonadota bacterium]NIU77974.1 cupin domain-containing protein [Gammaproteobacteria bacterium]NIX47049.1 cupin domain-containing protein [Gemmatimonadota bacterium]
QGIEVTPAEARPDLVGPDRIFAGTAIISPLFDPHGEGAAGGAAVTFAPGARTAWHSHPAGQLLVVTSGVGWVQERGGERRRI